ncbi:hypothetical protein U27_01540 [Candidatus Vecturithrix granuli]|uniref:Uncharacterized protein n=1 Tax=Vecturithrix granuli TaxID=1499967 RepID=A0A081CAN4_VECG1|nr:hypothetical protein U27_01540 [Candidatus Vecturithrix granuli]
MQANRPSRVQLFQTLPGIIPRFYEFWIVPQVLWCQPFQTLPGIIPRFYGLGVITSPRLLFRFKPFQGLFRVSTARYNRATIGGADRFKPFQGLFRVSTHSVIATIVRWLKVSNPSRDYSAFLPIAFLLASCASQQVSNPSRDYSAFLLALGRVDGVNEDQVSNPSRDYSAFLQNADMFTMSNDPFQTLPGIIPRFYVELGALVRIEHHVSNPSRDYSAFLLKRWKMLLIRWVLVSNPSRDYSAFLPTVGRLFSTWTFRFKPFQGLFRVSTTLEQWATVEKLEVSNPSRDYSAFLPSRLSIACGQSFVFQTLPGIIPRFYPDIKRKMAIFISCFKPFQGLFRVSTR